jgi:hypothetical protein
MSYNLWTDSMSDRSIDQIIVIIKETMMPFPA